MRRWADSLIAFSSAVIAAGARLRDRGQSGAAATVVRAEQLLVRRVVAAVLDDLHLGLTPSQAAAPIGDLAVVPGFVDQRTLCHRLARRRFQGHRGGGAGLGTRCAGMPGMPRRLCRQSFDGLPARRHALEVGRAHLGRAGDLTRRDAPALNPPVARPDRHTCRLASLCHRQPQLFVVIAHPRSSSAEPVARRFGGPPWVPRIPTSVRDAQHGGEGATP